MTEQRNTFETLVAYCRICVGAAYGRNAVDVMLQHLSESTHDFFVDYGLFTKKLKSPQVLVFVDAENPIFRTVHAHCLKCAKAEHGLGAVERMIEHADATLHKWASAAHNLQGAAPTQDIGRPIHPKPFIFPPSMRGV